MAGQPGSSTVAASQPKMDMPGGRVFANPEELLRYLKDEGVKFVDVRFCDLPGVMQHFNVPVESFDDERLHRRPRLRRVVDPRLPGDPRVGHAAAAGRRRPRSSTRSGSQKTLALNFFIHDPFTREAYSRDPRNVAKKAEAYLASSGIADTAYFGAEAEFYIFDSIRHATSAEPGVLLHRLDRGRVEHRPRGGGRQPRLQDRVQGRLLPGRRRSTTTPTCATRWCAT